MDLPGALNTNSVAIPRRRNFAERLQHGPLPWEQWQGARLASALETELGREIPELKALASEPNAEMFFVQLDHWAGRLESQGKVQAAGMLLTWIQANSPFSETQNLAKERLELWEGRGTSGALFEMALSRGAKEILQPPVLLSFGLGSLAARLTRLSLFSRIFSAESSLFLTRGLTSRLAWEGLGLAVEAPMFTLSQAALGQVKGSELPKNLAANFLSLGAMRFMGGAFSHFNGWAVSSFSREALTQAANFAGLLAGGVLEQAAGLKPGGSRTLWLTESFLSLMQIQTAQHLTGGLLGPQFTAFEQSVEQGFTRPRLSGTEGFGRRGLSLAAADSPMGKVPFALSSAWVPETTLFNLRIEELPSSKPRGKRLWESVPDHAEGIRQLIAGNQSKTPHASDLKGPLADFIRYDAQLRSQLQTRVDQEESGLLIRFDPGIGRIRQIFFFDPKGQPERVLFEHAILRYDENLDLVVYELNFSPHPPNGKSGPEVTAQIFLPHYQAAPEASAYAPPLKVGPTLFGRGKLAYEFYPKTSYHIQVLREAGVWQVQGEWGYPLFEIKP